MKYSDIVFRVYGDKLHDVCSKRCENTIFEVFLKKPFATSIIPIWHKTNKTVKNKIFLWILRSFSDLKNEPHEYFFLKKMKKWKHTLNYNRFEHIFHKNNGFSVVFEGKIRFSKKVKKRNLLASEPKNIIKKHKKTQKQKKLIFLIFLM